MEKKNNKIVDKKKKATRNKKASVKKVVNKEDKDNNVVNNNDIKVIIALIALSLAILPMYFNKNKRKDKTLENKNMHICINQKINKDSIIYKSMLKECKNDDELSKYDEIISNIKFSNEYKYSEELYINSDVDDGYILKPSDIYNRLLKNTSVKILTQSESEYELNINKGDVIINNLKDNTSNVLFNKEKIKYIVFCERTSKIIFITSNDELYISKDDINYKLTGKESNYKNIEFEKLSFTDIMNIILKYSDEDVNEVDIYAVDINGNEYRID